MEPTLYAQMGGAPFFEKLVAGFYEGLKTDPVLRPMYPEENLGVDQQPILMNAVTRAFVCVTMFS
jgi:hemoglobin